MEYDISNPSNPVIFLDISIGGKNVGRVLIEVSLDAFIASCSLTP
jgi:hypothetical protein